ncbi:phosphatidate cytidylyltransferase [Sulfurimonas sp. SAG-AH-194-I05]|nr:phosphatidate cytidylyltransferase [Sulfurimonas sp. SAG-AH-194-I05]MDF1875903.1 phosphatidate cytidylyltransferase [Sulfurimonas sp. SAG-AH-194-I05]
MDIFEAHRERILTGLGLVGGVLLIGIINNFFIIWLVLGAVYLVAFKEAMALFEMDDESLYLWAVGLWIVAGFYPHADDLFIVAALAYAGGVAYNKDLEFKTFLPFAYPTAGMLFILAMYEGYGVLSLLWLLVVVAMTDVGAYIFGKSLGKTQFCETSPNKTLEGVFGGIAVATIVGLFVGLLVTDLMTSFIISLLVAGSSIFGDLFESFLKRRADVKDSGDVLPGHGGILDRIDGYLFAGIVMLVLLRGIA